MGRAKSPSVPGCTCTQTAHRVGVTQPDSLSQGRKHSETASVPLWGLLFVFEMVSHWVAQAGLEFEVLLPWPSKCWNYSMHYVWMEKSGWSIPSFLISFILHL